MLAIKMADEPDLDTTTSMHRERWRHPYAVITDDPMRAPPALAVRLPASRLTADALLVARIEAVHRVLGRCGVPHVLPLQSVERPAEGGLRLLHREVLGEDLGSVLARGPVSLERAISILRQLCRAIGRAHEVGIEHRLLGPASVVITGRGNDHCWIEILDFGLAELVQDEDVRTEHLELCPITPERVLGGATSASEDIYSIGALAFWMLSGRPPLAGADLDTLRRRHAIEDCPSIAELAAYPVPRALADAVDRALAKDPEDRQADVAELEAAIVRAEQEAGIQTAYGIALASPNRAPRRPTPTPETPRAPATSSDEPTAMHGTSIRRTTERPSHGGGRRRTRAALVTLALGTLWLTVASARPSIEPAVAAEPAPDAPTVYAAQAPTTRARAPFVEPVEAIEDQTPVPEPPGPIAADPPELHAAAEPAAMDADEAELDGTELDDTELDDTEWIVIEDDDPEATDATTDERSSCAVERRAAHRARGAHRWAAVLERTRHAACWPSTRERSKLRVKALMELGRFAQCARVGGALARPDAELRRWVALCEERSRGPASVLVTRDRTG